MEHSENTNRRRAQGTAQLLEQLARRLLEKRGQKDLHAAQWSALRYFARAGRRTANIIGLSRYLGNTSGSTSRTARSLVDRDLLTVAASPHDARSVTFSLTEDGRQMLNDDPVHELAEILETLSQEDLLRLGDILDQLETRLAERRGR